MKPAKVVCLGVHLLDVLVRPAQHQPDPSVGFQLLDDLRITAAGTAAGPAVDLAKLGAEPISMGVLGGDYEGGVVVELMEGFGCDVGRLVREEGATTHTSLLSIDAAGQRSPLVRPGTHRGPTLDDIDFDAIAATDVLHVGGADMLGEFVGDPLLEVVRFAREREVAVTVDILTGGNVDTREWLRPVLSECDYFFPNEEQVAAMTETDDPAEGAARLRELGIGTVVATLGAEGSLIVGPEGESRVPAFDIDVVDTTGCGDAYAAGFIVGTAAGWDVEAAGWLGAAAASLVATGLGSDFGIVDLPSTLEFMAAQAPDRIAGLARKGNPSI